MNSITSEAHFRQRVIRYSEKYGVTAASIRHIEVDKLYMNVKQNMMVTGKA